MAKPIKLQPLKENVDAVEVNAVKVQPGDEVAEGQPLLEVQADKAALEVFSPVAGKIAEVRVQEGDVLSVGEVYCLIEVTEGAGAEDEAPEDEAAEEAAEEVAEEAEAPVAVEAKAEEAPPAPREEPADGRGTPSPVEPLAPAKGGAVSASPGTRRLAREWGIDLVQVQGTGRGGRIMEADLKAHVRKVIATPKGLAPVVASELPDFSKWGPVETAALNPVRRATARQMSLAWSQIPHVTQHDLADITDLEAFRKAQPKDGPRLTVTAFALKGLAILLREFPHFNSSFDPEARQLVLKQYVHIGVAVDTEHGLLVPVIRDVDKKSIHELADELAATAERARDRKLDAEELQGGTCTLTNLGGIGGTAFTPIVNHPEVAILGLSRGRLEPRIIEGGGLTGDPAESPVRNVVPRLMLPLSLSYDHRVIDGADGARFTRRLAEMLEQPLKMLLKA